MTRRERFRQYMTRVAAAADPALAIEQKLYIHPPSAISDVIVRKLEIEPTSRHLVVGSIGSGKTTQLLVATQELNALPDLRAVYVDVSRKQDLVKLTPGCLVALAVDVENRIPPAETFCFASFVLAWRRACCLTEKHSRWSLPRVASCAI